MRKRRWAVPVGAALDGINCGLRRRMEKVDSWSGAADCEAGGMCAFSQRLDDRLLLSVMLECRNWMGDVPMRLRKNFEK